MEEAFSELKNSMREFRHDRKEASPWHSLAQGGLGGGLWVRGLERVQAAGEFEGLTDGGRPTFHSLMAPTRPALPKATHSVS